MGRAQSRSILSQNIAEILGTTEPTIGIADRPGPIRKSLIYTSMALLVINPTAANAVGLGELSVNSRLGQTLDATVPITLGKGESLPKDCVVPTRAGSGIGSPANLQVSSPAVTKPGTYNLRVTTTNVLQEPMYEISLLIDCPGTPLLLRQYTLMLDLPGMNISSPAALNGDILTVPAVAEPTVSQPVSRSASRTTTPATNQRTERLLQQSRANIRAGQPYRVTGGDTLSTIAERVNGRAADTIWSVAAVIFAANPHAFIRNNPDLIKLGSLINIPDASKLAGLEKDRGPATTSLAAATATRAQSESVNDPQPMPAPAPIPKAVALPVAPPRSEVFGTEPELNQPDPGTLDDTNVSSADRTEVAEEDIQPFTSQSSPEPAIDSTIADSTEPEPIINPFLDETPALPTGIEGAGATVQPIPTVATDPQSQSSDTVNPLLAILVGLLLGGIASLLTLRRRLIDAVIGLLRRPAATDNRPVQSYEPPTPTDDTNSFDESLAQSAFDTQQEEVESLPIGDAAEATYIVESNAEATTGQMRILDAISGALDDADEPNAAEDDQALKQLFDDDMPAIDESAADIFDLTGNFDTEVTGTFSGPTAEMPAAATDENGFDPMAGHTAEFNDEVFDPTSKVPASDPDVLLDELTKESVDLSEADDMFETASNLVDDFLDGSPTGDYAEEPTMENNLKELPSSDDEDGMSETLQQALSLLESDFEDEFTESQILERSEISRSLDSQDADDMNVKGEDEGNADSITRKV